MNVWQDMTNWLSRTMIDVAGGMTVVFINVFYGIRSAWSSMVEWMATTLNNTLLNMETLWIRSREAFNPLGSAERTARLIAEATANAGARVAVGFEPEARCA